MNAKSRLVKEIEQMDIPGFGAEASVYARGVRYRSPAAEAVHVVDAVYPAAARRCRGLAPPRKRVSQQIIATLAEKGPTFNNTTRSVRRAQQDEGA